LTSLAIGGKMSPEVPMATKTLNISLPKELRDLVVREVAEGAYGSVSEYIREAVRASLARRRIERLERELLEGLKGRPTEMKVSDWRRLRSTLRERLARREEEPPGPGVSARRMSPEELARRFEEAARVRALIRRSTLEMRAAGERILSERSRGPQ
jgi:antitoxin ParD1/3/4